MDEILGDESVNLSYVPDVVEPSVGPSRHRADATTGTTWCRGHLKFYSTQVERTFYRRVFGFYSVVMDYVLADVSLSVLDVDMDVALRRDPE